MGAQPIIELAFAWACGVALGAAHFGSLWWVVQRLPNAARPGLWLGASTAIRFALTLAALYLLLSFGWQAMLAGVVGILTGRAGVVRATRWSPKRIGG